MNDISFLYDYLNQWIRLEIDFQRILLEYFSISCDFVECNLRKRSSKNLIIDE